MEIEYNGIELQVVQLLDFERVPQYSEDGTTYLYTRTYLRVTALLNPGATSYLVAGAAAAAVGVVGAAPASPVETDLAIRHRLSQPRRLLRVRYASSLDLGAPDPLQVLLEVPALDPAGNRYPCDARNGPLPTVISLIETQPATFVLEWAVTCHINECTPPSQYGGSVPTPPPILAHRWEMSEDLDSDYFSTRTVRGVVHFRTDLLARSGSPAEAVRKNVFLPVPAGFKREGISVTANSDGTGFAYAFQDRELDTVYIDDPNGPDANFGATVGPPNPRWVTHCEAVHERIYSRTNDIVSAGLQGLNAAVNANFLKGDDPKGPSRYGRVGDAGRRARRWLARVSGTLTAISLFNPIVQEVVEVELHGAKTATRRRLMQLALAIAFGKVRARSGGLPVTQLRTSYQLFSKVVSVSLSFAYGAVQVYTPFVTDPVDPVFPAFNDLQDEVRGPDPASDDVYSGVANALPDKQLVIATERRVPTTPPPGDGRSRGDWLGQIVAAALADPCQAPSPPVGLVYNPVVTDSGPDVTAVGGGRDDLPVGTPGPP